MTKILRFIFIFLISLNIQLNLCFAAKRDVQDPVLREIINEFGNKIPKFTNKYGESVFVQDGTVTRADLITALYEYDKVTKGAVPTPAGMNSQIISKNEFEALKNKVALLEKNGLLQSRPTSSKSKEDTDIVKLIADLETNMPMLLDNSLKYSKVFNELQQQVKDLRGRDAGASEGSSTSTKAKDLEEIKKTLSQLESDYLSISQRLDKLNSSGRESVRFEKNPGKELSEIKRTLSQLQSDYDSLSKRIDKLNSSLSEVERFEKNKMKKTISESTSTQYYDNSGSSNGDSKNTGKLVGLSLGLSMIAVLFVAR